MVLGGRGRKDALVPQSLTFLVFDDRGTVNQAMGYSIGEVAKNKIIFAT